jgi:hypothetical protein
MWTYLQRKDALLLLLLLHGTSSVEYFCKTTEIFQTRETESRGSMKSLSIWSWGIEGYIPVLGFLHPGIYHMQGAFANVWYFCKRSRFFSTSLAERVSKTQNNKAPSQRSLIEYWVSIWDGAGLLDLQTSEAAPTKVSEGCFAGSRY